MGPLRHVFCFTANGTCRTIERPDRRIGQRRDATRAPIQARNGWRPHGRRLGQPASPSKDGRNFVQTMGSTSYNLAYVNHLVCQTDNGRVLGYDNSHGFHHRHFMGKVEIIKFKDYETLASRFRDEVQELWRKEDEKDR